MNSRGRSCTSTTRRTSRSIWRSIRRSATCSEWSEISRAESFRDMMRRLPPLEMAAWHVFEADVLTDRNTLVCDLTPASRDALRCVQQAAVAALAGLWDRGRTRARYDAAWQRLSDVERSNIESCGFPFVGPIWHPHLSIAVDPAERLGSGLAGLRRISPAGPFQLPRITLYRLEEEKPVLVDRWNLGMSERGTR